jgi:hypothetical protein
MKLLAAVALAFLSVSPALATVHITNDMGGKILKYERFYNDVRYSEQLVIIDGPCFSACSLVAARVPSNRVCITPRAVLGFHSAWYLDRHKRPTYSREATREMWNQFPSRVRQLVRANGWDGVSEHPDMVRIGYGQLLSLYKECNHG